MPIRPVSSNQPPPRQPAPLPPAPAADRGDALDEQVLDTLEENEDAPYNGPDFAALQGMSVRERIEAMKAIDRAVARQFAQDLVFQYSTVKMPLDQIAARMGYTVDWVVRRKREIKERWRKQAQEYDIRTEIAGMLAMQDEIIAHGLREVSAAKAAEYGRRMAGLQTAQRALDSKAKLLQMSGAFDNMPLRPQLKSPDEQDENSGVNVLKNLAQSFLEGRYGDSATPPASKVIDQ